MLSSEELQELKETMSGITTHIPEHKMGYIWNTYNRISGDNKGPQPCACASAAKYWRAAVDELNLYLKENG
jgi:hypothetical protein